MENEKFPAEQVSQETLKPKNSTYVRNTGGKR
jgi:hypothetical protein